MTMLGMQSDMQCHYFPSYFSNRDANLNASFSVWPSPTGANKALMNGHFNNGNLAQQFLDPYLAYKEKFKQIMLQHEAIFKSQVHELHRLYNKQRRLMVEMKSMEYKHIATVGSSISWLNPANGQSFIPVADVQSECSGKGQEFLESKYKRVGKKILDLELPAYEYIDIDTEEGLSEEIYLSEKATNSKNSFSENVKCFADLNEPAKLEDEIDDEFKAILHPVSGLKEIQCQVIENTESKDPFMKKSEDQHECLSGIDEHFDDIEQGAENSPSDLLDLSNGNLLRKRKYQSTSFSVLSSRKHLERVPVIVQALPCSKSCLLLRGSSTQRSCQYAKDNSSADVSNEKNIKGIDLNAISPCYSPDAVSKSSNELYLDCNSMPDSQEQINVSNSIGLKFQVDLNSYIDDDASSAFASMEMKPNPPESPGKKEQSPHGGDSDKLDTPCELPISENEQLEEDPVKMAAEALVSISQSEGKKADSLNWFANIASSIADDGKSEFGLVLSSKNQDHDHKLDYFEAMTLQLEEIREEEYFSQANTIQVEAASSDSLPKIVRPRRGRQQKRKDFQNEILPSLASLSWYEVTEDLQAIGGLIEASKTVGRRTGRNGFTRGRRGRRQLNKQTGLGECSTEERRLLDWGKITRRPRGPRCPASNFRLIVGQV